MRVFYGKCLVNAVTGEMTHSTHMDG